MKHLATLSGAIAIGAAVATLGVMPVLANDITTEWASVKPPPVPELKPVTIDPKTTGLLVLDLMKGNCGTRPRCIATVPNVRKLLDEARAHNMMVFYTLVGQDPTPAGMVDQSLVPRAGEFLIKGSGGADKFVDSDLDQGLKDKGIKTVIVTGTIGHHFSISAFCKAPSAAGVCWSRGGMSCPRSARRWRTAGSASTSATAALSLAIASFGVPLGTQSAVQLEK
jgi:hypothetical protein